MTMMTGQRGAHRPSAVEPSGNRADGVTGESAPRARPAFAWRSIFIGIAAAVALALVYVFVLSAVGGAGHVQEQWAGDAPWVVALAAGFGVQTSLMIELRRRHRLARREGAAAGAAGGASAVGMVACCAHHAADLAPLLGATGIAVALTAYRTQLMVVAVIVTAVGIVMSIRQLRRISLPPF
jgi:hypothetical protein